MKGSLFEAVRDIEERLVQLRRELGSLAGPKPGLGASDYGCCSDKGCCQDKGCCKDKKGLDPYREDLVELAEKLGVPIEGMVKRIEALDPKLLGAR